MKALTGRAHNTPVLFTPGTLILQSAGCAQNGLGTARGTLRGIAAAETVLGQRSDITAYFAQQHAPKPLSSQPFATWGGNAHLAWKD